MTCKHEKGKQQVITRILHELEIAKVGDVSQVVVDNKRLIIGLVNKYLSITFHIDECRWELVDTSGYTKRQNTSGVHFKKGISLLVGRIKHHKGEKKKEKVQLKRAQAYETPTQQQMLSRLKNFEKYYEKGYSLSKAARLAKVEYKTAKSYINGELVLEVN